MLSRRIMVGIVLLLRSLSYTLLVSLILSLKIFCKRILLYLGKPEIMMGQNKLAVLLCPLQE
jgi:hypothetical protein